MTPDLVFAAVTVIGIAAAYHAFRTWVADRALARGDTNAWEALSARLDSHSRFADSERESFREERRIWEETATSIIKRLNTLEISVEAMARDVGAAMRHQEATIAVTDSFVTKDMQKALAEDWFRKFQQLERDINVVKSHTESQLAGTLAAIGTNTSRGFNR